MDCGQKAGFYRYFVRQILEGEKRKEKILFKDFTKCLILRMRSVPALDITAMNALDELADKCLENNITLIFSHVSEQPMRVMEKTGFIRKIGKENFCKNISAALKRAESLLEK